MRQRHLLLSSETRWGQVLPLLLFGILVVTSLQTYAAPVPSTALQVPAEIFIGNPFSFTATFDNTSPTEVGYGPFIDLVFPVIGTDGAGAAVDDGIDFLSAAYLGAPVTAVQRTFGPANTGGCTGGLGPVSHPYAVDSTNTPLLICGAPGNKLVTLQLPFGSFTPDQPAASITVSANLSNLADLGTPLTIRARAGFQFGQDPLNNPAADPSIVSNASSNSSTWAISAAATPTLITLTKTYIGPEDETATGPNFPRQYTVTVTIAPGQTVTNLDIIDDLPNNMAFLSLDSASPGGSSVITTPTVGVAANPPNNRLLVRFPSVTGSASITLSFYIPLNDANGSPVIHAVSGDDVTSINDARAQGTWTPIDTRDLPVVVTTDLTPSDHTPDR